MKRKKRKRRKRRGKIPQPRGTRKEIGVVRVHVQGRLHLATSKQYFLLVVPTLEINYSAIDSSNFCCIIIYRPILVRLQWRRLKLYLGSMRKKKSQNEVGRICGSKNENAIMESTLKNSLSIHFLASVQRAPNKESESERSSQD